MRLGLEYIAAFLDCDGCVCIVKANQKTVEDKCYTRYYVKVGFYSQNLAVLENIMETVGGKICTPTAKTMVYQLQLAPKASVAALHQLAPYLQIKKEQALTCFEFQKQINGTKRVAKRSGKGGGAKLSDEIYAIRHAFYLRVCELNHKDSQAFRTNRVNSGEVPGSGIILSQAVEGEVVSTEGATTREMSPNNNSLHETPARKGRYSLGSAVDSVIQ